MFFGSYMPSGSSSMLSAPSEAIMSAGSRKEVSLWQKTVGRVSADLWLLSGVLSFLITHRSLGAPRMVLDSFLRLSTETPWLSVHGMPTRNGHAKTPLEVSFIAIMCLIEKK